MSVSDKGFGLLPFDPMNQVSLGFLETMTVIYKLSKLDPHLQDIYSLVWEIMKIYTHTALTQEQGPRVKGTKLQDSMGGGDHICGRRSC